MLATSHRVEVPASPSLTARDRGDVKRSLPPSFPFVLFDSRHVLQVTVFTSRLPRSSVLVSLSLSLQLHLTRLFRRSFTTPLLLHCTSSDCNCLQHILSPCSLSPATHHLFVKLSVRLQATSQDGAIFGPALDRLPQYGEHLSTDRRRTGRRCRPGGQRRSHRSRVT
jgi:hypothetical protein